MKWTDIIRIAEELHEKFPDADPATEIGRASCRERV